MTGARMWAVLWVAFCAVYLYLHLFTFPTNIPIFYEEDHLYFMHDAWRMYQGEALYRDFFEYTFPGTQVFYWLLLTVFGPRFWIINAVILVQGLSLTLICLAISTHLFGRGWRALLAPSVFLFFGFRWFGVDGSHRMLSPIFVMLAILVLLKRRSTTRIALAGVCCALASYFTQQRGFLAVGAITVFLVCEAWRNRSTWRETARDLFTLVGTFVVTLVVLVLPFVADAGVRTFVDYTIVYITNYVQHPTANYGAYTLYFDEVMGQGGVMAAVMLFYYLLIPLVYVVGFLHLWRRTYHPGVLLVTLMGSVLALGTFAPTPGRLFQVCMPGLILFSWLLVQMIRRPDALIRVAVTVLVIVGGALAVRLQVNWERQYLDTPTGRVAFLSPVTLERYAWILDHTSENEPVFEVYQPAINFLLQRPNPTRLTFLQDNGYTPVWQVAQAIGDLDAKKPRFIIWDGRWSKEASERLPGDHLAPLYDYLRDNYELRQRFTPYSYRDMQAWQRKE
jgi:hypothetical protein